MTTTTTTTTTTITAYDHPVRISPGTYVAITDAIVTLFRGVGDSRAEVSYSAYRSGEEFNIVPTVNGFWYGLESDGNLDCPSSAEVAMVK